MRRLLFLLVALGSGAPLAGQTPRLLSTDTLAMWLQVGGPTGGGAGDSGGIVVIDVRRAWVSYLENHLPGAVWLNVETLRAGERELPFQLLPASHYAELFYRLGIAPSTTVAIYSAGDQFDIDATFVAWLLASAGATRVYVLDGGYAKWELEGRPLTQRYPRRDLPRARFDPERFHPAVATLQEAQDAAAGSGVMLVDARPADQYRGSAGAQLRRGHIPGAISHPWNDDLAPTDPALMWKPVDVLRAAYRSQGVSPDRDIILYCNSSTEASHVFFALKYLLGYPRVRIFTGAWSEWAEREELPIEK